MCAEKIDEKRPLSFAECFYLVNFVYRNVLPYFKKSETHKRCDRVDEVYRGSCGPLHTTQAPCSHPLQKAFTEAAQGVRLSSLTSVGARYAGC